LSVYSEVTGQEAAELMCVFQCTLFKIGAEFASGGIEIRM
jgi:hypothetical protein